VEHYKNAPQKLQDELSPVFDELEDTIAQEFEAACTTIIANNPSLHLYSLGLYYHSWDYILPTYSTQEGLAQVAKSYAIDSEVEIELEKESLRWSPCDSPHHGEDELEYMMPITEALLEGFSSLIDMADPMYEQYEWPQAYTDDRELYYDFISELHEKFESTVISAMNRIWKNKSLSDFFIANDCALTLNAGDSSYEDFLGHIKKLNNKKIVQKLTIEIESANKAYQEKSIISREKEQQELANPPTTALTLADFQDVIDNFNPTFKEENDGIFLDIEHEYPLFGSSEVEESANRIELMKTLEASPHYEEIRKLYGHFIGPAFHEEDLLPCICRALVHKLGEALTKKYSNRAFSVYMRVERDTLYFITFISYRHDGHQFFNISDEYGQEDASSRQVSEVHAFYSPNVPFEDNQSIISSLQKREKDEDNPFSKKAHTLLIQFETAMNKEIEAYFVQLIEENANNNIYTLGLNYESKNWRYLLPFVATNEKLNTDATFESSRYHDSASAHVKSQALKWNQSYLLTCIEDMHKTMMPETNALLTKLNSILSFSDPELLPYAPTDEAEISFEVLQKGIYQIVYELVINAMNRVRSNQKINEYLIANECVLTLISEQTSYNDFFMQVIKLNGTEIHNRVKKETSQGLAIDEELRNLKEDIEINDLAKSVFDKLTLEDFQDVIDNFTPSFIKQGEAILLYDFGEESSIYPSQMEEIINSTPLMSLLSNSRHFESIDQLYSNGIGPSLKPDDLLPRLCQAIVDKLGNALSTQFKNEAFFIKMYSDRYTPYQITFITERPDGYKLLETPIDKKARKFMPDICKIQRFYD